MKKNLLKKAANSFVGRILRRLAGEEKGVVMMEYIVVGLLIAAVAVVAVGAFGNTATGLFGVIGHAMRGAPTDARTKLAEVDTNAKADLTASNANQGTIQQDPVLGAAAREFPIAGRTWPMFLNYFQAPADTDKALMSKVSARREQDMEVVTLIHGMNQAGGLALTAKQNDAFLDFSAGTVLCAEVTNVQQTGTVEITAAVNSGPDRAKPAHRVTTSFSLNPGESRVLKVPLRKIDPNCRIVLNEKFRHSLHGLPSGMPQWLGCDAKQVTSVTIYSFAPFLDQNEKASTRFAVGRIWLTDELPENTVPLDDPDKFFPFIDRYGQFRHQDWPEKIRNDEQLSENRRNEAVELARLGRPADWSRYGGWTAGPQLKATGSFRAEKYRGKWFLVDPDGYLFFSSGVNDLGFSATTDFQEDRAHWQEEPHNGKFSFMANNLRLKYGHAAPYDITHRRLAAWGLNTIGAWSNTELVLKKRTPYTVIVIDRTKRGLLGSKFFDPFDPFFQETLKQRFTDGWIKETVNDPFCIGYFIGNELYYGEDDQAIGRWAATAPAGTPAKQEFLKDLKQKYRTVEALNHAWGTAFATFEAFQENKTAPGTGAAKQDMEAFHWKGLEEFFKVSRNAVRQYAPDKLYLGARHAKNRRLFSGKFAAIYGAWCDVASYNLYHCNFEQFRPEIGDKPFMITETHMNILQRGMFHPGSFSVGLTPDDRATAVKRAYHSAFRHPNIVGVHWFLWNDQPLTGRSDGENLNAGLVDITDTPYPELTGTLRELGEQAIRIRLETSSDPRN